MFQFCHARAHDPNTGKNTGKNTGENTGKNTGKILEKIQEKYKKNTGEKLKSETFAFGPLGFAESNKFQFGLTVNCTDNRDLKRVDHTTHWIVDQTHGARGGADLARAARV